MPTGQIRKTHLGIQIADYPWVAAHMTPEQAAALVLDCFNRAVRQELELLDLECVEQPEGH